MTALTLFEQQALVSDARTLAVMGGLMTSELTRVIPFKNVDGGAHVFVQDDELPTADFRAFDESNEDSIGSSKPQAETVKIFGKDIKTDSSKLAMFGPGAHRRAVDQAIRAMRLRIEDLFINGNFTAPNPRHFDGLKKRLPTGSSQCVLNHPSAGAPSLAAFDEVLDAVDAAPGDKMLIVPKSIRRQLSAAMRSPTLAGNINLRPDEFGKQTMYYGEARVIVTDVNNRKQVIQDYTDANSTTSIYAVAFGDGMLCGIQGRSRLGGPYGVESYDVGEMHVTPTFLTRIVWHLSMVMENERAAARLANITNAAIVA
jgi:hypothetical protein